MVTGPGFLNPLRFSEKARSVPGLETCLRTIHNSSFLALPTKGTEKLLQKRMPPAHLDAVVMYFREGSDE